MSPSEPHVLFVHFPQVLFQAPHQFLLGCDLDVAEHLVGHLGEEGFDQVQPRPVERREDELESVGHCGQMGAGFFGGVRQMVIQDHLDSHLLRVFGVQRLKELNELVAAAPVPDQPDVTARAEE